MGFPIPPEPTKAEIDQLRNAALQELESSPGTYDPKDVDRIRTEDKYIRRFLMHHDNDQKLALDMVKDTLKWRQEMQVNSITKESIPQEFFDVGALYIHNRDKDDCKMLVFCVRVHVKGVNDMEQLRRFLVYYLERLEREEQGEQISVFFDMTNTGMKNMDMDLIQYMINLFKSYYPWILNYIIVFEMPWLLSAMWKIIKAWLPPKSIDKIKFVDRKSLKEFVDPDQALVIWGGTDPYEYKFDPEELSAESVVNGDVDATRKVRFEEGSAQPPISPAKAKPQLKRTGSGSSSVYLDIEPSEELMFNNCRIGGTASLCLTNSMDIPLAFKIKTTSPEKYRVKPSVGILEPGCLIDIGVTVSEQLTPATLVRDKFLVMSSQASSLDLSNQEVSQIFKNLNKDDVYEARLRVGVSASDSSSDNGVSSPSTPHALPPELVSKIDQLLHRQAALEERMHSFKKLGYIALVIMILILLVVIVAANNMASSFILYSAAVHNAVKDSHSTVEEHSNTVPSGEL